MCPFLATRYANAWPVEYVLRSTLASSASVYRTQKQGIWRYKNGGAKQSRGHPPVGSIKAKEPAPRAMSSSPLSEIEDEQSEQGEEYIPGTKRRQVEPPAGHAVKKPKITNSDSGHNARESEGHYNVSTNNGAQCDVHLPDDTVCSLTCLRSSSDFLHRI